MPVARLQCQRMVHIHFGRGGGQSRFLVSLATELAARGVEQQFVIRPDRAWESEVAALGPVSRSNFRPWGVGRPMLRARLHRLLRSWSPATLMAWGPRAAELMPEIRGPLRIVRLGDPPRRMSHYRNCDALVGNTPEIVERACAAGWSRRAVHIPNFVRPVEVCPVARARLQTPEDCRIVAAAGRFVDCKGLDVLLRAVSRLPNHWLWLIGDGPRKPELEALASTLGIGERTRFTGWLDEPLPWLAASDAVVVPSRHEAFGNVVIEAWRVGVPVVASRSKGPAWLIDPGRDGLLFDIDDVDGLAAALAKLEAQPLLASRLADGGRDHLAREFSPDGIVDQYMALFATSRS